MARFILSTLTAERLREVLAFDPDTGVFTWTRPTGRRVRPGDVAGTTHEKGYLMINIDRHRHYAHRLAWFWVHGTWGSGDLDHINGDKADNRIANLREATRRVNLQNQRKAKPHNKLGVLGVFADNRAQRTRFVARIVLDGRCRHLGSFETAEEAHAVYLAAKRDHHPGCTI